MTCPFRPNAATLQAIPQPPQKYLGLFGNLPDVDPASLIDSVARLSEIYGPMMKMWLNEDHIWMSNQKHVHEICNEDRFEKKPESTLVELRPLLGDGLFSADSDDENWWKAHRILVPAFGPLGIRKMFDDMVDLSSQLVLRWDREGPSHEICMADDLTRLAFDTIGLCVFSYRFNEFYSDHSHPFAEQLGRVLLESGKRSNRTQLENRLHVRDERQRQADVASMHALADEIIAERKKNPQPGNRDLLDTMLNVHDPETGTKLSDENIRYNLVTFLAAGHETTSSTLSFTYYYLLKNPEKLHKAQQQVDEVVGGKMLTVDMIPRLTYIDACTKEAMRLGSPIPTWAVAPKNDEVLDGRCPVAKGTLLNANLLGLHRDTEAWGNDVLEYRPERFLDGGLTKLPSDSFKPFGNGRRACIGRGFAEQEMVINIAMVLQRFQLELADPAYSLKIQTTLTRKPFDFRMKVRRRPGRTLYTGMPGGGSAAESVTDPAKASLATPLTSPSSSKAGWPALILFGGNSGTCEGFAQELQMRLAAVGGRAAIQSLDSATEHLPTDRPVLIITASYEGRAPDNAKKFVAWLQHLSDPAALQGVRYSVMGVGNSDWASTFHRIPKLVDDTLAQLGASRLQDAAWTNVKTDLVGPLEEWCEALCGVLAADNSDGTDRLKTQSRLEVHIQHAGSSDSSIAGAVDAASASDDGQRTGIVLVNRELAAATAVGYAKRHMDVQLPAGTAYTAGDYLAIAPRNSDASVQRVLAHFQLRADDLLSVRGSAKTHLPSTPTPAATLFASSVELHASTTRRQFATIAAHAGNGANEPAELQRKVDAALGDRATRASVLDVLEALRVPLPLATYLDMLPPLAPRQYSMCTSPLAAATTTSASPIALEAHGPVVSICFDVHSGPSFDGVASTFLASRREGEHMACWVRPTHDPLFRLPAPSASTPIIMVAAGTGIAPMRAFVAERAAVVAAASEQAQSNADAVDVSAKPEGNVAAGNLLPPAVLYYGCRDRSDALYADELAKWEAQGLVRVRRAFSRPTGDGESAEYVADAIWAERAEIQDLWHRGAKMYLCGSAAKLGRSVADVCMRIHREVTGDDEKGAQAWLDGVKTDRYISDVY